MSGEAIAEGEVTLVVAFDGTFWCGTVERVSSGHAEVARHVFGAEPSPGEVLEFVRGAAWSRLRFISVAADAHAGESADGGAAAGLRTWASDILRGNPKRRMREAARAMRDPRPSTRAQDVTRLGYEERVREARPIERAEREAAEAGKRAKDVLRRKAKHRGR